MVLSFEVESAFFFWADSFVFVIECQFLRCDGFAW